MHLDELAPLMEKVILACPQVQEMVARVEDTK